jgi:broad specificity phosphatase PhoE
MKIYLIRHGESTSDVKEKYDGDYDDHLTQKGLNEAKLIAQDLLNSGIKVIFSSPKIRAVETSQIVCNKLNCNFIIIEDLAEQDIYSAYLDLGKKCPEEEYRKLGEILVDRDNVVKGAETYKSFKSRIIKGFSQIVNAEFDSVAIITHGGPIRCIFREILNVGEIKKIENGAIIELEKKKLTFKVKNIKGIIT